jgi:hypothetical protein
MRTRPVVGLLACCCAAVTACTAAGPKGPAAAVTTPAVGRPPAPSSAAAALASEAFTAYAELGESASDGLAPGDTYGALHTACMNDAGYGQYAASAPYFVPANHGIGFPEAYGPQGYIGVSLAEQYAFNPPETDGPDEGGAGAGPPVPGSAQSSLPAAVQTAEGKCYNIVQDFSNAQMATSNAGIVTLTNDIGNDVGNDPNVLKAQHAWAVCMAKNGYASAQPNTIWRQYGSIGPEVGPPGSSTGPPTASQAQIAAAVTDAHCTLSTDLGGISFAVQASYERQLVTANQQALNAAVREFKANYAKEISKLPALLRTASATPSLPGPPSGKPGAPGRHGGKPSGPSPARS